MDLVESINSPYESAEKAPSAPFETKSPSPSQMQLMQSVEKLSAVSVEEVNRMAYKDMNRTVYVSATLGFYALIVVGAIAITNISVVFNFVGALAVTAMVFCFPAYYFTQAVKVTPLVQLSGLGKQVALSMFPVSIHWL